MTGRPRLTQQSLRVLKVFYDGQARRYAGFDVMRATGIASGTLYPILMRFETHGLLESEWENQKTEDFGRPRRRLYSMTSHGRAVAHDALTELAGFQVLHPVRGTG